MKFATWIATAVLLLSGLAVPRAEARDMRLGLEANWADDADFGIGARVDFDLDAIRPGLGGIASFDYFFPDDAESLRPIGLNADVNYWEINANATYGLPGRLAPYVGAGLNLSHGGLGVNVGGLEVADSGNTDAGLNLLGGIRVADRLFGEARVELGGGKQFILTLGFLF
jgi:opacity protein-like surface antigen